MKRIRKILSLVLVAALSLTWLPTVHAVGTSSNSNYFDEAAVSVPAKEQEQAETSETVKPVKYAAQMVEVTVKATNASGNEVLVPGATVNLYVGNDLKTSAITDSDGVATLSLAGMTASQKAMASISAFKTVDSGSAISGTNRNLLFNNYEKNSDGEPIRYEYQLHSETIDSNGNWCGAPLPDTVLEADNKIDIAFAIDATGSMADEINNVQKNLSAFSEALVEAGYSVRFCIVEYHDMSYTSDAAEQTRLYESDHSRWFTDVSQVRSILSGIQIIGGNGGDNDETPMDALGLIAQNETMQWRSDAHRFAFLLTDAGYKTNNAYGYSSLSELAEDLKSLGICTSVICDSGHKSTYSALTSITGGSWVNIYASNFQDSMMSLAGLVSDVSTGKVELKLSEPRMLCNLSVAYLANDVTSQSSSYQENLQKTLQIYAQDVAQATDGHVLIDNFYLLPTSRVVDFYDTSMAASMADIHIETRERENVRVHSNAYVDGFFGDNTVPSTASVDRFQNLDDSIRSQLQGRNTFLRIQLSAVEGAGWENSFIDNASQYATTIAHESGHYLLGFFDEYMDGNENNWDINRPYYNFGLMDGQHDDIEISKVNIDYNYIKSLGGFAAASAAQRTRHAEIYQESCEDTLADVLTSGTSAYRAMNFASSPYLATYTKVSGSNDRTASYSCSNPGFHWLNGATTRRAEAGDLLSCGQEVNESLGRLSLKEETVYIVPAAEGDYQLFGAVSGSELQELALTLDSDGYTANLNDLLLAGDGLVELYVAVTDTSGAVTYNTYYLDVQSVATGGITYQSADFCTAGYFLPETSATISVLAENVAYSMGDYHSVNQATTVYTGGVSASGEIYTVASRERLMNYDSLKFFRYDGNTWTELDTILDVEENGNIGAACSYAGEGTYVLMAKAAGTRTIAAPTNLAAQQSKDRDAVVTLTFSDPNSDSKYYQVYYSEESFTNPEDAEVTRVFDADSTEVTLDLLERDRQVYVAVCIVASDGSRSEPAYLKVTAGSADTDGDGIPDWYCDEYQLWPPEGQEKDIANSDDDGDGLTNLEEYRGGSDPTDPNDPVQTTDIAVEGVSVSPDQITLNYQGSTTLTASITPANATNQDVSWYVADGADDGVVSLTPNGNKCRITAKKAGVTEIVAVSVDGGYVGRCTVIVPFTDVKSSAYYAPAVNWAVANNITAGTTPSTFSPDDTCTRGQVVAFLWRAAGRPEPKTSSNPFTDVKKSDYFYKAVLWASENGIVYGTSTTTFSPNQGCTRGQVAAFLWRAAGRPEPTTGNNPFTDVKASEYYGKAVIWAAENKIVYGTSATQFSPEQSCTRAQIVTFLYRTYGK